MNTLGLTAFVPDHRTILGNHYALLNPMSVDPEAWSDLPVHSLVPTAYVGQSHLFPLLIELEKLSLSKRIDLLDRMQLWWRNRETPFFCALLVCTDEVELVCRHLVNRMVLRLPDGKDDVLRFYDQRVFQHLLWMFDREQKAHLLGNISEWSWCGPDGAWLKYENSDASPSRRLSGLWRFSDQQWGSLFRLSEINQGLATLERKGLLGQDDVEMAKSIDALLNESWTSYQLEDAADRWLFTEQAIRFGKNIHRHPRLRQLLVDAGKGGTTYVGACADLDDDIVRQMATELKSIREEV